MWISESGDVLPKPHSVRAEGDGSTCRGILDTRDSQVVSAVDMLSDHALLTGNFETDASLDHMGIGRQPTLRVDHEAGAGAVVRLGHGGGSDETVDVQDPARNLHRWRKQGSAHCAATGNEKLRGLSASRGSAPRRRARVLGAALLRATARDRLIR